MTQSDLSSTNASDCGQDLIYALDMRQNMLTWTGDPVAFFGFAEADDLVTGGSYSAMLDNFDRLAALKQSGRDTGLGVPFQLRYVVIADATRRLEVDDIGRWFADDAGEPWLVHGTLKLIAGANGDAPLARETDLLGVSVPRTQLRARLDAAAARARSAGTNIGVLLVGISDLSALNVTYGAVISDHIISAVARRLRKRMRRNDEIIRFSGAKFAIVLAECKPDELDIAGTRFLDTVCGAPIITTTGPVAVDIRIGAALFAANMLDVNELVLQAEQALRDARGVTSPAMVKFSPNLAREDEHRANMEASDRILSALNERRIVLAYQPLADAKTRKIVSYEGLVRLRMRDGVILGADQLVPAAERVGLLKMIDHRVVEIAITRLARYPTESLSVNVAVPSAMQRGWLETLTAGLQINPGCAARLTIEITETAMIDDMIAAQRLLGQLRDLGVRVAIDDFGSGHTSFKALKMLPVNIVKIDGSFIKGLASSADDRFFVKTLVDLAHHLGMKTTAEWVLDETIASILTDLQIDYLQGDAVGEPVVDLIHDERWRDAS